jgi:hypothetical protein
MEDEEDFTSPLDFASLSGMARQADVDVQKQIKNYRDMITKGAERMRQQRLGPSNSEFLLSLAQAFGAPTRTGSFGERMGLVAGTLGGQESARREAELARADMLEKLGLKGAEFELGAAQTRANMLATLMARQAAANKPDYRVVPEGGSLVDIKGYANLPVYTPEQVAVLSKNPANRGVKFRTVDGRPMEM